MPILLNSDEKIPHTGGETMSTTRIAVDHDDNTDTIQRPQWLDSELYPFQSHFVEVEGNRIHYIDEVPHYDCAQDVAAIQAPTLIVIGDADTVRPAHALELFELLGGGKAESAMGKLSKAQLAVLPGTTEFSLLARVDLRLPIITPFLEGAASASMGMGT
jgi:pimeloyl-ACP methyl ester carboxylesterase